MYFYLSWLNLCLIQQLHYQKHWMKKIHQFLLLKLKMKLLNQSDSSFVPQPLTKATLECEPLKLTATTIHAGFNMVAWNSMLKVCWKYLEKLFWIEYLNKYIYWQKVFKIPKYQILNLQYFKYQIPNTKIISNTYLKYKYFKHCPPLVTHQQIVRTESRTIVSRIDHIQYLLHGRLKSQLLQDLYRLTEFDLRYHHVISFVAPVLLLLSYLT